MESVFAFTTSGMEKIMARLKAADGLAVAAAAAAPDCKSREVETRLLAALQKWEEAINGRVGEDNA